MESHRDERLQATLGLLLALSPPEFVAFSHDLRCVDQKTSVRKHQESLVCEFFKDRTLGEIKAETQNNTELFVF